MNTLQKYLFDTLGIDIHIDPFLKNMLNSLPLFLRGMYRFQKTQLFNREIILLQQNGDEYLTADQYLKHIRQIEKNFNVPVVLVLEPMEAYNRKRLIEKQVAFIIPGKQMFIPQLLIDLKEFRNAKKKKKDTLQPASQCLLFYHLLKENVEPLNFKMIAERTNYTPMTITRAATDLAEREICRIEGRKDKRIIFDADKRAIWEKAQPFLQNPVKNKIYIDDQFDETLMYRAGYSALTFYTNITGETNECFAIAKNDYLYLKKNKRIVTPNKLEGRFCIEIWKYAPGILAENKIVDPLSLYLALKEDGDERVEKELEKMIERLW